MLRGVLVTVFLTLVDVLLRGLFLGEGGLPIVTLAADNNIAVLRGLLDVKLPYSSEGVGGLASRAKFHRTLILSRKCFSISSLDQESTPSGCSQKVM